MASLLLVVVVAMVVLGAFAWRIQDRLVFYPQPLSPSIVRPANVAPFEVRASDATVLRGWIRAADRTPAPTIVYFGGNAEEVSWTMAEPRWPAGWNVVALNYRGYGESEGAPSEHALVADAQAIVDAVSARPDVARGRIVAFGRSLGTGVAVQLAATRPLAGVVLASPYDSLIAVGGVHYPLLPVRWLLRHRFESIAYAPAIRVPMLTLVAEVDALVPIDHSRTLFDAWGGPRQWIVVPRTDHGSLAAPGVFWEAIERFVGGISAPAEPAAPASVAERER